MVSAFYLSGSNVSLLDVFAKNLGKTRSVSVSEFSSKLVECPVVASILSSSMIEEASSKISGETINVQEADLFVRAIGDIFDSNIINAMNSIVESVSGSILAKNANTYEQILEVYTHQVNGIIKESVKQSLSKDRFLWELTASRVSNIVPPCPKVLAKHAATHVLLQSFPEQFVKAAQTLIIVENINSLIDIEMKNIHIDPYVLHKPENKPINQIDEGKWSIGTRVKKFFDKETQRAVAIRSILMNNIDSQVLNKIIEEDKNSNDINDVIRQLIEKIAAESCMRY